MTPRHRVLALVTLPLLVASCAAPNPTTAGTPAAPPPVSDTPSAVSTPEPSPTPTPSASQPSEPAPPPTTAPAPPPAQTTAPRTDDPAQWESWTLTTAGWGPVRPDQPLPASLRSSFKPGWECLGPRFVRDGQEQVMVFTKDGKQGGPVTNISLLTPRTKTASGVRIGDSEEKLRKTYPKLQRMQAPRGSGWMVRVWYLEDDTYNLFFEVDQKGTVKHISVQKYREYSPMSQVGPCGAP